MSIYLEKYSSGAVEWYSWGKESFLKAKTQKKPIFLSIGYSTSALCEQMREESFENKIIAELLNKNFISIKIDKDERPDIDKYYKNVYKLMNGQNCASPISVFLTENLEPFYTATYIAPYPKGNVLGFEELLRVVIEKYSSDKVTMIEKGEEVLNYLHPKNEKIEATKLNSSILKTISNQSIKLADKKSGGFGKEPKFPHISTLDMMLDAYELNFDKYLLEHVLFSLKKMAKGNIHDSVNGGFYRYTKDREWNSPHPEKMSYDNANLCSLYIRAYNITKDEFYKNIAIKTAKFMLKDMSDGTFFYSNALYNGGNMEFVDKKLITSWSSMVIDALLSVATVQKEYLDIAINSLEQLLEKLYINSKLYHTEKTEAFLEDYAYLGTALLSAYRATKNSKYLILSEKMIHTAIDKFYENGKWRFSNSEFKLYDDITDLIYPSALATITLLMQSISPFSTNNYATYIFRTLEMNSYNLMRQPFSSPKMTKALLLYLKDDIMA